MKTRRGRESSGHLEVKLETGKLFNPQCWKVFFEHGNADILLIRKSTGVALAIEVESTPKNLIRNIERNFENGCSAVGVVDLSGKFQNQFQNRINRNLSGAERERVAIFGVGPMVRPRLITWCLMMSNCLSGNALPKCDFLENQNDKKLTLKEGVA